MHEALLSAQRQAVLSALFLLLTGQLALIIAAFRDGRSRRTRLLLLAPFALTAAVFWLCLLHITWEIDFPNGVKAPPPLLQAFNSLPLSALILFEAAVFGVLVLAARDTFRYRREHVTPDSVKRTMDLLPVGIACGRADGAVLFRNLVMDRISVAKTGKLLTDLNAFRGALGGGQVSVGDDVWQIGEDDTPDSLQLTATRITEQARLLADLEAKNKKLKDIHLRLGIYNRQAERIIIAQEMLAARMAVHDELGHILLESRHYMNDPGAINEALLLKTLKNANAYLLREYEQDDTARDALADAVDTAKAIGVEVTVEGRIPSEEPCRGVLAAALQECAANTVKHADGSALLVRILEEDGKLRFLIENNGAAPAGPIAESGGLLSLRALTESRGGRMDVESAPSFRLSILLPAPADTFLP